MSLCYTSTGCLPIIQNWGGSEEVLEILFISPTPKIALKESPVQVAWKTIFVPTEYLPAE